MFLYSFTHTKISHISHPNHRHDAESRHLCLVQRWVEPSISKFTSGLINQVWLIIQVDIAVCVATLMLIFFFYNTT